MNNNLLIAIVILTAILSLLSAFDIWVIKKILGLQTEAIKSLNKTDEMLFKSMLKIKNLKRKRELANEDND